LQPGLNVLAARANPRWARAAEARSDTAKPLAYWVC